MIDTVALLEGWAAALWRASWQGGLAALAVWFVGWLAPSLPARFQAWLWRLVIVKFVVVLLWTAPLQVPLLPAVPIAEVATWEPSAVISGVETLPRGTPTAYASGGSVSFISPLLVLFIAWVVVVGVHVIRIGVDYRAASRLRRGCRPSENGKLLVELAAACKSVGLSRSPELLETAGQGSPLLIGIFRPAIILPVTTLSRLSDAERSLVIGHELAHARRGDLFWSLLANIVRALFCFHPLAWLSERHLRLSQEIAADELSITFRKQDPISYATLLLSVISKLGPRQMIPALSVGVEGSPLSLRQRFSAMRFMKPVSRPSLLAFGSVLCLLAVFGVVPWTVVAAQPPAADLKPLAVAAAEPKSESPQTEAKKTEQPAQKVPNGAGEFVSYQDGTLTLKTRAGTSVWKNIGENYKTFERDEDGRPTKPTGTIAALSGMKAGMAVRINGDKSEIYFSADEQIHGTFVSYKDGRLTLIGRAEELAGSFARKYGTTLRPLIDPRTPVHESIDGGEFKLIGSADVLSSVKEGAIVTLRGKNDTISLIQIGRPQQK